MGILTSLRQDYISIAEAEKRVVSARQEADARSASIVSAYYTSQGTSGTSPDREYWQLVDAFKSWVYSCLNAEETIKLADGTLMPIKKIVDEKFSGEVLSFNTETGRLENKKVIGWYKSPLGSRNWVKVSYKSTKFFKGHIKWKGACITDDHRVLTERGYVQAKELTPNDKIATRFKTPNAKQKELIIGMLLGNSHIAGGRTHSNLMVFNHTLAQSEWVDLKIKGLNGLGFKTFNIHGHKRTKAGRGAFSTTSPFWNAMRRYWYDGRKKRIPETLSAKDLTPLVLAVWYMDDGCLSKQKGRDARSLHLCSESFTLEENKKLLSFLKQCGINGTLNQTKGGIKKVRIYIGNGYAGKGPKKNGSAIKFFRMIAPYVLPSMRYKLPPEIVSDKKFNFDPELWRIGNADPFFDYPIVKQKNILSKTTYCIDVEDNHNFICKDMVLHNCVDKIGKSVAMIPLKLNIYRSKQSGKIIRDIQWKSTFRMLRTDEERKYFIKNNNLHKEEIYNHSFLDLLSRPNEFMTRFTLWYNSSIRLEINGLCGWLKIRDGLGVIRKVYPLPLTKYAKLTAKVSASANLEYWEYRDGDVYQKFKPEDVFVMLYPNPASPFKGMSPLMAQTYPYDIDLFLMQQQKAFFEHGANPGLHLTTDQYLKKEQVEEMKQMIDEQYAGSLKAGDTLITHSGLKAEKIGQTGRESMIDVVARFARDKLITAYDLSPGKLGLVEDVNRSNMAGLDRTFIHECLRPKCMLMEESIEAFLLPEYDEGLTCDFELPSVEDQEYELKAMETRLRSKVTVVNEEREKLGKDPRDWGNRPWGSFTDVQLSKDGSSQTRDNQGKVLETKRMGPDFWTDERKDIYWKLFVGKSERLEQIFLVPMKQHFKNQCEEVLKRLDKEGKKIVGQYAGWSRHRVQQHLKENKAANLRAINIDKKEERAALTEKFTPIAMTIMKEYGDDRIRELNNTVKEMDGVEAKAVALDFNVNDPRVQKWLGARMKLFSEEVAGTTFDEIEAILREGFAAGEPVVTIAETLRQKFDSWDRWRAPLISRAETLSAMNKADIESVYQCELESVLLKAWLSARDGACRPTHLDADIRYSKGIPMDENFRVGADTMPCPGNGSLAEENLNCRCILIYLEKEREE